MTSIYRGLPFILLVLLASLPAKAQQAFNYLDVFELQFAAAPQISPDGETIIYQRVQYDIMTDRQYSNLWQIDFSGENHLPITSGKRNYGSPAWSPDGSKIAYTSSEEGSNQLFIRWMEEGRNASVTNVVHSPAGISWSPDGKYILFTMRIPADKPPRAAYPSPPAGAEWAPGATVIDHVGYRADGGAGFRTEGYSHIFLLNTQGGAPRQLTSGNVNHTSASWAPDSQSILYTADKTGNADLDPNNAQIYELNIHSGESRQITDRRGPFRSPVISPDGELIAYTGFDDQFTGYQITNLYVMNRDGSGLQLLSENFDRDINSIRWAANSESIFFRYDDEGAASLGIINLGGEITPIANDLGGSSIGRPYTGGAYSVAENGRFVYTRGFADKPSEIAAGHHPTRMAVNQLTNLNENFFTSRNVGKTEEFWVDSSVDDFRVQGWIITPPDFDPNKKYPLILEIHGGPHTAYGPHFTPELQLMASQGYVVVYTNPRGSTSYGEAFGGYINHNYPSEDYNDLMDAVDEVIARGYVDENRLYITGGSGGGVLTAWAIGKTDRFAAAVVSKPVINWYSFVLTADSYPFFTKYWFTDYPWNDPEQYLERSPISLVGNVTTPTMLLTGEADYRTPMSETEQYYTALKMQNVDAAMVRIPEASHGIVARPSNLIRKVAYIIDWFERYPD